MRLALFKEGHHALRVVSGEASLALKITLKIELSAKIVTRRGLDRLLGQAKAAGRSGGKRDSDRASSIAAASGVWSKS